MLDLTNVLKAVLSTLASVPGAVRIATGLGTIPGYEVMQDGLATAVGSAGILLLWSMRSKIRRIPSPRVFIGLGCGAFAWLALFVVYRALFAQCVVSYMEGKTRVSVLLPVYISDDSTLGLLIKHNQGRFEALDQYGASQVNALVKQLPAVLTSLSDIILLLLYEVLLTSITCTIVALAIRATAEPLKRAVSHRTG